MRMTEKEDGRLHSFAQYIHEYIDVIPGDLVTYP